MDSIIRTENLHRTYHLQGEDIHAVRGVSLGVERASFTVIMGRTGSGKTSLLNLISALDTPDSGKIWIEGEDVFALSEAQRVALRRDKIGFVFQNFGLLPLLSAAENVSIPLRMRKLDMKEIERRVAEALEWVGLHKRANHRPYELSGGEQQRVAIARALAAQPEIILADEPTGQLDSQTGAQVLSIMHRLVADRGITMLTVTHDPQVMDSASIVYRMTEGNLEVLSPENTPV